MNFIQQAYKGKNDWWRYLLMTLFVFFGWQIIGIIPLVVVALLNSNGIAEFELAAADNFMSLGINSNLYLFSMIMMFAVGLFFIFLGIKSIHKRSITSLLTSRKKLDWKRVLFAFGVWFLISLVILSIDYFGTPENFVWNFKLVPFLLLVAISFLFLPLQTSFEEVLFRGYLMQSIGFSTTIDKFTLRFLLHVFGVICLLIFNYYIPTEIIFLLIFLIIYLFLIEVFLMLNSTKLIYNSIVYKQIKSFFSRNWVPLIVTSVSFGLLHSFNPEVDKLGKMVMVYYIGTGFLFGISTLMDEGMELSLGMHAANNIVAAVLVTTNWTVFQTDALFIDTSEPSLGMETYIPVFVIYPLLLLLFSKKYGWENWKEKLFGKIGKPIIQSEDRSPLPNPQD